MQRPSGSSDLNPCDFYPWGILEYEFYGNNFRTKDELKKGCSGCPTSSTGRTDVLWAKFNLNMTYVKEKKETISITFFEYGD
jgi:hypothetical protein